MRHPMAMAVLVFVASCGITPKQAEDVTGGACKIVDAFDGPAIVDSICATAPELAGLAAAVAEARRASSADAGAKSAARCRPIPDTTTCATDAELRVAIPKVKATR